jgi:hypothetical protein
MKTLYIVAVLAPSLDQQASRGEPSKTIALLQAALGAGGREVVFYHALVDGWDATDRVVAKWISEQSVEAARKWRTLTTRGRLRLSAADNSLRLPDPTESELSPDF